MCVWARIGATAVSCLFGEISQLEVVRRHLSTTTPGGAETFTWLNHLAVAAAFFSELLQKAEDTVFVHGLVVWNHGTLHQ